MAMLGAAVGATAAALQEQEEAEAAAAAAAEELSGAAGHEHEEPPPPSSSPLRRRRGRSRGGSVSVGGDGDEKQNNGDRGRSPSPPPLPLPRFRELGLLSSLVAGWSAFPSFALLVTVCLNATYLRFASFLALFTEEEGADAEPPSAAAVAFLTLRTLSLLFTARNALAMSWDFFVDSVRDRPILNPLLFRNVLDALRIAGYDKHARPTRLLLALHFVTSIIIFLTLKLLTIHEILPALASLEDDGGAVAPRGAGRRTYLREHSPLLVLLNLAVKALLCCWFEGGCPGARWPTRLACLYTSFSDALLLLWCVAPGLAGVPPHGPSDDIDAERQQHILAFNLLFFILVNLASAGLFTLHVSTRGPHAIQSPQEWDRTMRHSRVFSVAVVGLGWALSVARTGLLPSLFTLCILLSGVSLNRFILVLVAKSIRTGHKLVRNLRWLHRRLARRQHLGYALLAALVAWVHWAYGASGVGEAAWLLVMYLVNITYKYQVQMTRKDHKAFFKHNMDYIVFGPLSLVLAAAIAKLLRRGQWAQHAVAACLGGNNGCRSSNSNGGPPPLFTVQASATGLNVSSVLNTMELTFASTTTTNPPSPAYPFCGTKLHGLSLLEYALFSLLSYMDPTGPDFAALFQPLQTPEGGAWAVFDHHREGGAEEYSGGGGGASAAPTPLHPKALAFRSKAHNLTLVAIQGTNPLLLRDLFQDVILFHRAFTFELTAQVAPLLRWIPSLWTSYLLYLSVLPERLLLSLRGRGGLGGGGGGGCSSSSGGGGGGAWGAWGGSGHAAKPGQHHHHHDEGLTFPHRLVEAVAGLKAEGHRVVLTGHSLGGSLAKIVAAAANVPVVAVASPGVFLSARGFGVDGERLKYLEANVVCENDLFPWLDRNQGVIFHLACAKPNPFLCHQPGQPICELVRACGDVEPRLFAGCRFLA